MIFGESYATSEANPGLQFFVSISLAGHVGVGAFVGAGAEGGFGTTNGPLPAGFSVSVPLDAEAEAGYFATVGVSGQADSASGAWSAMTGLPVPKLGVGIGAYGGLGRAVDVTLATPLIDCQ